MVYDKFIVEGNNLILSKCTYHKQLCTKEENVKGGGWFNIKDDNTIILGGSSHDFGSAEIEDIKDCIKEGNVFSNRRLSRKLEGYKFFYNKQSEIIDLTTH